MIRRHSRTSKRRANDGELKWKSITTTTWTISVVNWEKTTIVYTLRSHFNVSLSIDIAFLFTPRVVCTNMCVITQNWMRDLNHRRPSNTTSLTISFLVKLGPRHTVFCRTSSVTIAKRRIRLRCTALRLPMTVIIRLYRWKTYAIMGNAQPQAGIFNVSSPSLQR